MFRLFSRKPDVSQAARELGAIARRNERQRFIETTNAMRAAQGKPAWNWRDVR